MDSIKPWLDTEELNKLANALMQSGVPVKEGVAKSKASQVLAKASALAKKAGLVDHVKPRQAELPELANWLQSNAQCEGVCVVDSDGDVLHASIPSSEWVKLAVSVAIQKNKGGEQKFQSVRFKVTAANYLQLIKVDTARGVLLVGLLTRHLLRDEQLAEFESLVERISGADQVG